MSGPYCLKKFHVKNYKILEDAEFEFMGINILIGRNGAGKTALWEAMSLITDLAKGWDYNFFLRQFRDRGRTGFPEIVTHFDENREITFQLQIKEPDGVWDYEVSFGSGGFPPSVYTSCERLRQDGDTIFEKRAGERDYRIQTKQGEEQLLPLQRRLVRYPLLLSKTARDWLIDYNQEEAKELGDSIANWSFYRFDVRQVGKDYEKLKIDYGSDRLETEGHNLPRVLFQLKQAKDQRKFQRVRELFKTALDLSGFKEVDFDVELDFNSRLFILKLYKDGGSFDPAYGPDGWKAMLLLFTALVQEDTGLVFIEEPETHIYPHFMELLAEEMKAAAARGVQVFCTTHSTSFVNFFDPDNLIILDQGKPRRTEIGHKLREVALTLGDAWLLDLLED
jgi:predicted ATPase